MVEWDETLSEFPRLMLLGALSTQGHSIRVAVETLDLGAVPLTAAVTLATVKIRLGHMNQVSFVSVQDCL